jgi:hypothetical protein
MDAVVATHGVLHTLAKQGYDVPTDEDSLRQVAWLMASVLSRLGCLDGLPGEPLSTPDLTLLRGAVSDGRRRGQRNAAVRAETIARARGEVPAQRAHLAVVR